jgi:LL-diaminopimelate aminotransferase
VFDDTKRLSFLQTEGAKDIGIELNSVSKPFNMTGWRLGMAMGNADLIAGISRIKENVDAGIFNPIQYAGITALTKCQDNIARMIEIYERHRGIVVDAFNSKGWNYTPPPGTFYLWMPTPTGVSSMDFTEEVFEKASVVVTAGTAYGQHGEGYFRIAPTIPEPRLREAMERLKRIF